MWFLPNLFNAEDIPLTNDERIFVEQFIMNESFTDSEKVAYDKLTIFDALLERAYTSKPEEVRGKIAYAGLSGEASDKLIHNLAIRYKNKDGPDIYDRLVDNGNVRIWLKK